MEIAPFLSRPPSCCRCQPLPLQDGTPVSPLQGQVQRLVHEMQPKRTQAFSVSLVTDLRPSFLVSQSAGIPLSGCFLSSARPAKMSQCSIPSLTASLPLVPQTVQGTTSYLYKALPELGL